MHLFVRTDPRLQHGQSDLPFSCLNSTCTSDELLLLEKTLSVRCVASQKLRGSESGTVHRAGGYLLVQCCLLLSLRCGTGVSRGTCHADSHKRDVLVPCCYSPVLALRDSRSMSHRCDQVTPSELYVTAECSVAVVISFFLDTCPWHEKVHWRRSRRSRLAFLPPSGLPQGRQCARKVMRR